MGGRCSQRSGPSSTLRSVGAITYGATSPGCHYRVPLVSMVLRALLIKRCATTTHYCINSNYENRCVMERWTIKYPNSLQILIEVLTKPGSIINGYASTFELFLFYLWISDIEYSGLYLCLCGLHLHLSMLVGVVELLHRICERFCHIWSHLGTIIQYYTLTPSCWLNDKDDILQWWWWIYLESSYNVPMEYVSPPFVWFWSHSTCLFKIMGGKCF